MMNELETVQPKDEKYKSMSGILPEVDSKDEEDDEISVITKFTSELIKINRACRKKSYRDAYDALDIMRQTVNSSNAYSDKDRAFVMNKFIQVLTMEYKDTIIKLYVNKLEQYRNQMDHSLTYEYELSRYPGNFEDYIKMKVREEIGNETRKLRYGGYMHVIISNVISGYEAQEKQKAMAEARLKAQEKNPTVYSRAMIKQKLAGINLSEDESFENR